MIRLRVSSVELSQSTLINRNSLNYSSSRLVEQRIDKMARFVGWAESVNTNITTTSNWTRRGSIRHLKTAYYLEWYGIPGIFNLFCCTVGDAPLTKRKKEKCRNWLLSLREERAVLLTSVPCCGSLGFEKSTPLSSMDETRSPRKRLSSLSRRRSPTMATLNTLWPTWEFQVNDKALAADLLARFPNIDELINDAGNLTLGGELLKTSEDINDTFPAMQLIPSCLWEHRLPPSSSSPRW